MSLFFVLLGKIIPLYLNIGIGYILSKYLKVRRDIVAFLLVYILGPAVIFFATLSIKIDLQIAFLPIMVFLFGSFIAFFVLMKHSKTWKDSSVNTLAFTCGTGNTGYFGIPLAMILLNENAVNIFIFVTLASLLYENTTGFFVTAKGAFSAKQSIHKILRLPLVYAFILGVTLNILGVELSSNIVPYFENLKWIYGILGMMMLGMGLKGFDLDEDFDKKYIKIAYFYKFFIWPLFMLAVINLDKNIFMFLNEDIYDVLFLMSIVPLAGNTVTLAILLKAKPEKASFTVLLSNLVSIIYIPLTLSIYQGF
ncbi:AEC family transporter [Arcobacter sp. CECT 8985]|uniref:AEC family transporter n=1 Tax=Arcobacter sp. CECT 8985 TaxID=1935424 RepID=UPI00100B8BB9|nr:transporter [Arcobacter sp. CECT 8985]RXJ85222.1 transporter [Arcobacter sp. CECT 8985]